MTNRGGVEVNWRHEERRAAQPNGWTLAREVVGTILGVMVVAVPLTTALIAWGSRVETKFAGHDAELIYLHKENDKQDLHEQQQDILLEHKLERIEQKIDKLGERK
jgi:hypothetical protein